MKSDVVLVANSPGELSALVKPVAEEFSQNSAVRVILVLTPCQYTSGRELGYVKNLRGISELATAEDYKRWILRNQKPNLNFSSKGVILYLGGDLAHALLVARKLKYPSYAYVQDFVGWKRSYKKFFVPDRQSLAKLKLKDKYALVGNLMVDSIKDIRKWSPEPNVITFLPGSRAWQIKHMTPIYKRIISELRTHNSELKFQIVSSPFEPALPIEGAKIVSFEEVYNSELVITIPGTNTARLSALGLPMICLFPLDNPDVIPLEGLLHYICSVPYFGSKLKRFLAGQMNKRIKYFALPNIKAGREVIPEIRGAIHPAKVAREALALLKDKAKRSKMSGELIEALGKPGAAKNIAEEINAVIRASA